jgi:hypothetical protein
VYLSVLQEANQMREQLLRRNFQRAVRRRVRANLKINDVRVHHVRVVLVVGEKDFGGGGHFGAGQQILVGLLARRAFGFDPAAVDFVGVDDLVEHFQAEQIFDARANVADPRDGPLVVRVNYGFAAVLVPRQMVQNVVDVRAQILGVHLQQVLYQHFGRRPAEGGNVFVFLKERGKGAQRFVEIEGHQIHLVNSYVTYFL